MPDGKPTIAHGAQRHPTMPAADLRPFVHSHAFADAASPQRAGALRAVTWLTLVTMVLELIVGYWSGSLALTADGWHMGTHAAALGGAALAMGWAQRAHTQDGFAFGGWKIEVLTAYTSALLLAAMALSLAWDAVRALWSPQPVAFVEAMTVAVLGLVVNLASVWLLARPGRAAAGARPEPGPEPGPAPARTHHGGDHEHEHVHGHGHGHGHSHGHDHNFQAAYLHVLADAFTSVLAIVALAGGLWGGWRWLDPVVALLGAVVIGQWSFGLLRRSARALVDASTEAPLREAVYAAIEGDGDARLADLHVWQVGAQAWSAALSVVAHQPLPAPAYHQRLAGLTSIKHLTIEVHQAPSA